MTCLNFLENQSVFSHINSSIFSTSTSTEDGNDHESTSNSKTEEMIGNKSKNQYLFMRMGDNTNLKQI